MIASEDPTPRAENGRFLSGQSGNPKGRPRSESVALRESLASNAGEVVAVVVKKALEGDMQAAKLVLERVAPALKPAVAPVSIEIPEPFTALTAASAFLQAAAAGKLAPDVAVQLVSATGQLCRITEIEELRERLEALEHATRPATATGGRKAK